jgi:hypothetical protein
MPARRLSGEVQPRRRDTIEGDFRHTFAHRCEPVRRKWRHFGEMAFDMTEFTPIPRALPAATSNV